MRVFGVFILVWGGLVTYTNIAMRMSFDNLRVC